MSQISVGTVANDGTGDPLRTAFQKINQSMVDSFNVKYYGAKGDGTTDDTAAINAAILAASTNPGPGTVVFPPNANLNTHYVVAGTLILYPGIRLIGLGGISPTLRSTGLAVAMMSFMGTSEAQTLQVEIRNLTLIAGTVGVGIGLRLRNFQGCVLEYVSISGFRVGAWMDWGVGFTLNHCTIGSCTRGFQSGGNLSQTETPIPTAGIRGGPGTHFMDSINIGDTGFSQNQIDINDLGSQQSLGGFTVWGSSFFELYSAPVAGKTKFLNITRRKGFVFRGNWVECGTASRDGLDCVAFDYDGNAGGPCYGTDIQGNHFLFTSNNACNPIYIVRGQATIKTNVIEVAIGGSTVHYRLGDSGNASWVEGNTYLAYPDSETTELAAISGNHVIWKGSNFAGQQTILTTPGLIRDTAFALTSGVAPAIDASMGTYFTLAILTNIAVVIGVPANPPPVGQSQDLVIAIRNVSGGVLTTPPTFNTGAGGFKFSAVTNPANGTQVEYRFRWDPVQSFFYEVGTHLAAGL